MAERSGNFTDVCTFSPSDCPLQPNGSPYPNNQVPIGNPTVANALIAMIPAPNLSDGGLGAGVNDLWFATPTLPMHWRQELFRIDQNVGEKV